MYTNTSTEGGPLTLPPQGVPVANFELRVLFDHSLFEVNRQPNSLNLL